LTRTGHVASGDQAKGTLDGLVLAIDLGRQGANFQPAQSLRIIENCSSEVHMDKKTASLVGAISALVTISAVEAARAQEVTDVLSARSYAELLQPIPNAVALLMAADEVTAARDKAEAGQTPNVQLVRDHHHHHHHHRRHRHHHHHHHHHNGY
jgi:hypothetical protein